MCVVLKHQIMVNNFDKLHHNKSGISDLIRDVSITNLCGITFSNDIIISNFIFYIVSIDKLTWKSRLNRLPGSYAINTQNKNSNG